MMICLKRVMMANCPFTGCTILALFLSLFISWAEGLPSTYNRQGQQGL